MLFKTDIVANINITLTSDIVAIHNPILSNIIAIVIITFTHILGIGMRLQQVS